MKDFARLNLLLAGFVFCATTTVQAQLPEIPPGKFWKRPRIVETLHITAEQQERLDEVFAKNRRAFIDLKAELERRSVDLEELLSRKDADQKKIAAASEALEQARGKLGKARTMMVVEMRGILTEAQWKAILERREQWRAEREGERRRFRTGGPARRGGVASPSPQGE